jgi:hypothetical protein
MTDPLRMTYTSRKAAKPQREAQSFLNSYGVTATIVSSTQPGREKNTELRSLIHFHPGKTLSNPL